MNAINHPISTAADIIAMLIEADVPTIQRRDMISGVSRICTMLGCKPEALKLNVADLRVRLAKIRPAAHGITKKSLCTLRCSFAAALGFAGAIDELGRGDAKRDPSWAPLVVAIASNKRLANGLAAFTNWCARQGVTPEQVDDAAVQRFATWLEGKTLHPKPRDRIRGVPTIWNEAREKIAGWPDQKLSRISFKLTSENLAWADLPDALRREADDYLDLRAEPDLFETDPTVPKRPLAPTPAARAHPPRRIRAGLPWPALRPFDDTG